MASLRELLDMCKVKGIKFKGKTKAQLLDALKANDGEKLQHDRFCEQKLQGLVLQELDRPPIIKELRAKRAENFCSGGGT